jgi:hypothetical protein
MRRVLTRAEPVDHGDGLFTDHAAREAQDLRMTVGKVAPFPRAREMSCASLTASRSLLL